MRSLVKRALIAGYCHGAVPAWAVSMAFRLFRLKGA